MNKKTSLEEDNMENKINIAELLKDCPRGMELDCTILDNIIFDSISNWVYPIKLITKDGSKSLNLTKYGYTSENKNAKCVIFPKGKTTWEGFEPPCKFKIEKGKWYVCTKDLLDNYSNKAFCKGDIYLSTQDGSLIPSNSNVPFEVACASEYFRDWTIQDAKDGDVIFYDDGWTCIFKYIHGIWFSSYCFITDDGEFHTGYERHAVDSTINGNAHLATKEQCNFLFKKIKEAGYKWNPEIKILEELPKFKVGDRVKHISAYASGIVVEVTDKGYHIEYPKAGGFCYISFKLEKDYELVPNKFDITTLKPFDRVLGRDKDTEKWHIQFFEKYNKTYQHPFICMGYNKYKQCIPYEGNEHLHNTTNDCDDFYKTWEK